jgi:hypothetical protein
MELAEHVAHMVMQETYTKLWNTLWKDTICETKFIISNCLADWNFIILAFDQKNEKQMRDYKWKILNM